MDAARRYNRWIVERLRPGIGTRVLEVGSGTGTLTALLEDRELLVGVEVVPEFVDELRRRYAGRPSMRFELVDISAGTQALAGHRFDSAVSANVFEHIPDDQAAMEAVFKLLEPGGTFALLVPAHRWLLGALDRSIGHFRRYSKAELRARLVRAGFEVESLRYSNPVGALGWLVNVKLLGRTKLGGVGLFDRLVPALERLDTLTDWPFGLQLVAIARKPRKRAGSSSRRTPRTRPT